MAGALEAFASALISLIVTVLTAPVRLLVYLFNLLFVAPLEPHERFHGPPSLAAAAAAAALAAEEEAAEPGSRVGGFQVPGPPPDGGGPVVSFGGCGFMYPWQLGVARFLCDHFDTAPVRSAGHSAGFASALTVSCGVPVEAHWHALQVCEERWRSRLLGPFLDSTEHWMGPYVAELQPHAERVLGAAAAGRLHIGYTRIRFRPGKIPWILAGHAVKADFSSIREFVYTVTVSQRIVPFYRRPGHLHGAWGLDGAFSGGFTLPPGVARSNAVCVSPVNPFADVRPEEPPPLTALVAFPTRERWDRLFAEGYSDARRAAAVFVLRGFTPRLQQQAEPAAARRLSRAALLAAAAAAAAPAAAGAKASRGASLRALAAAAAAPAGAEEAASPRRRGASSRAASPPPRGESSRAAALRAVAAHSAAGEPGRRLLPDRDDDEAVAAAVVEEREPAGGLARASRAVLWPVSRLALEVSAATEALAGACRATAGHLRNRMGGGAAARRSGAAASAGGAAPRSRSRSRAASTRHASLSPPPRGRRR